MKALPIFGLLMFVQVTGFAQIKNFVLNGSFEGNPSYQSWKTHFGVFSKNNGGNPGSYVWLNDNGGANDPSISQVLQGLVPGTIYLIKGDFRGGDDSPLEYNFPNRIGFAVDIDQKELAVFKLPSPVTSWESFAAYFKATHAQHALQLRGEINGTNADIAVDNVVVEKFPSKPDIRVQSDIWQYGFGAKPEEFMLLSRKNVYQGIESLFEQDPQFGVHQNTTNHEVIVEPAVKVKTDVLLMKVKGGSDKSLKIRFVAPVDATYQVMVKWTAIHQKAQKNKVAVYSNAQSLAIIPNLNMNALRQIFAKETHGFNDTALYKAELQLRKGEIISFEAGAVLDQTYFDVLKTTIQVVPKL